MLAILLVVLASFPILFIILLTLSAALPSSLGPRRWLKSLLKSLQGGNFGDFLDEHILGRDSAVGPFSVGMVALFTFILALFIVRPDYIGLDHELTNIGRFFISIYGICLISMTYFYLILLFSDPGVVAGDAQGTIPARLTRENATLESDYLPDGLFYACDRSCYSCRHPQAGQTHHCRACNVCVAQFDHHCFWVNNCIGPRNKLYFLLWSGLCGFGILSLGFAGICTPGPHAKVVAVVGTALGVALLSFCLYHVYLAACGVTTYETYIRSNVKRLWRKHLDKVAKGLVKDNVPAPNWRPYDRGVKENLARVWRQARRCRRDGRPLLRFSVTKTAKQAKSKTS